MAQFNEAQQMAAQEFNETAGVDSEYLKKSNQTPRRRGISLLDKLRHDRVEVRNALERQHNISELENLLEKNPEIARIFDLIRELGL